MKRTIILLTAAAALAGCATITKGTEQDVLVNTDPQGARCELSRGAESLGVVDPTPGTLNVEKSSTDILISCELAGYQVAKHMLQSEAEMMTAGNLVFGGLIGLAVDAGSGAMNKYDANITVILRKEEAQATASNDG